MVTQMSYIPTAEEWATVKEIAERDNPDHVLVSFDVIHEVPCETGGKFLILQNVFMTGRPIPGGHDGQPVPIMIAASYLPFAGYLVKL